MQRPALARSEPKAAEADAAVPAPPRLHPLERPRLASARGVVLGVALGLLVWAAAGLFYWLH